MAIWLNKDSKVIVQGMTGATGMKHTKLMLGDGTNVVGGVNPRKAGQTVDFDGTEVPVFGTVKEAIEKTGANVTVIFVPEKFTKDAVVEAIDAEIPLAVVITEGIAVHDTAAFWAYAGEKHGNVKPANFLDIGGGASAQVMANGLEIILGDPDVKSVFVNVFGGITACDEVANGIVQALKLLEDRGENVTKPLVVRLDGNNAELGRQILTDANHPLVQRVDTMDGAADKAAELANAAK